MVSTLDHTPETVAANVTGNTFFAQSFTTGAATFLLDRITLDISYAFPLPNGATGYAPPVVGLYSSLNGTVNDYLARQDEPALLTDAQAYLGARDSAVSPSSYYAEYLFGGTLELQPSQTYWIVATPVAFAAASTWVYSRTSGASNDAAGSDWTVGSWSSGNFGSWSTPDPTFPQIFSVSGIGVSAVPEPSTYAALAGALALGVTALRRRRPRA